MFYRMAFQTASGWQSIALILEYGFRLTSSVSFSFVGHSLGNLIIRAALTDPAMLIFRRELYTYLSLAAPHCGLAYCESKLVNMGKISTPPTL